jgi:hypothetical protein
MKKREFTIARQYNKTARLHLSVTCFFFFFCFFLENVICEMENISLEYKLISRSTAILMEQRHFCSLTPRHTIHISYDLRLHKISISLSTKEIHGKCKVNNGRHFSHFLLKDATPSIQAIQKKKSYYVLVYEL